MLKTKNKLFAAGAMLLVSVIMLTTASFAWFTISTAPEIKGMTAGITANGNLEIAIDNTYADMTAVDTASKYTDASLSGKAVTWGNLADLTEVITGTGVVLKPVQLKTSNDGFQAPIYGKDGRVSELSDLTATGASGMAGVKTYNKATPGDAKAYAYSVDFWVRSNQAGTISLTTAVDRGTGEAGLGSFVSDKTISVKFLAGGALKSATVAASATDEKFALTCDAITTLVANEAQKITMFVYLDGATLTNKDALLTAVSKADINVQFKHDGATLTPMVP